ncbi:MAG: ATP-dependent helicase HrpB [Microthrixaceae bacterium]
MTPELPVLEVIDEIRAALGDSTACVLVAPPGTGKTTGVPPALLDEPWLGGGRIVMLEPRRLAARASAHWMARTHGERVGERFGYSVRGESRTSSGTRIEVMTEGLFLRRLQNDPTLERIGAVILDEFHERSVDSDLALALLSDLRSSLRPDLRIMIMSATIEPADVATLLAAPVVTATAEIHPVETLYRPGSIHVPLEVRVAEVVVEALQNQAGDVLVFLPGRPEINRCRRALEPRLVSGGTQIVELHGSLSPAEQQVAIEPSPDGRRRVVLATSLAETSITVPGVRSVVDSGRRRTTRFDPRTGLPALVTVAVSRSGADQRRGRAGRTAPGVAYRLWANEDDRHRPASDEPEILTVELSPLMLQLRAWGVADPAELDWLDLPPPAAVERARDLLRMLGAVDGDGHMTPLGRRFAQIGFHPRLAAMACAGAKLDRPDLAAEICARVETARSGEVDLVERLDSLHGAEHGAVLRRGARGRRQGSSGEGSSGEGSSRVTASGEVVSGDLGHSLRQWRAALRALGSMKSGAAETNRRGGATEAAEVSEPSGATPPSSDDVIAQIVMAGYPDRIARRRAASRTDDADRSHTVFQLRTGGEVTVPAGHSFERSEWLAVVELDSVSQRLHLGVALSVELVMKTFGSEIESIDVVEWNDRRLGIDAKRVTSLGAIKINETLLRATDPAAVAAALGEAFRMRGLTLLGRLEEASTLRSRVMLIRETELSRGEGATSDWPDFSDQGLQNNLLGWLGERMNRVTDIDGFNWIDVISVLREQLRWDQLVALDELAPTHWKLNSGRSVKLHYGEIDGDPSTVLASIRLRDAFGTDVHPSVMAGEVLVAVELLSPAGRPVQRTKDLRGFWRGSYRDVRSDLRGRYPKHPWPEEPWRPIERS